MKPETGPEAARGADIQDLSHPPAPSVHVSSWGPGHSRCWEGPETLAGEHAHTHTASAHARAQSHGLASPPAVGVTVHTSALDGSPVARGLPRTIASPSPTLGPLRAAAEPGGWTGGRVPLQEDPLCLSLTGR